MKATRGSPLKNARQTCTKSLGSSVLKGPLYSRPVIPLLLSLIIGIFLGDRNPHFKEAAYLCLFAGIIFGILGIIRRRSAILSPLIIFLSLGYLSILPWAKPDLPANHVAHVTSTQPYQITGIIDDQPVPVENRFRFTLNVRQLKPETEASSKPQQAKGKIQVTLLGDGSALSAGDQITFVSRIKKIRNFNNPGGFNYKRYMVFKGVWASTFIVPERIINLQKGNNHTVRGAFQTFRKDISDTIDRLQPLSRPGETKAVLKAVLVGIRNEIHPGIRKSFNRAGVSHILAISGLHIGIVATGAFFLLTGLLSHIRIFLWEALTRKGAAIFALLPVFAYGFLSGMSPSTQRAVIMVSVFLLAILVEKEHEPTNTLAAAALLILIHHPPSLFLISFQLSFVSVLSIIYGLGQTCLRRKKSVTKIPPDRLANLKSRLGVFFLVSVFAVVGTLPLAMHHFNQISVVGVLANLLVIPLIGFVAVPLGLIAVLIQPLSQFAAWLCFNMSAAAVSAALEVISFFSRLPFAAFKTVTPNLFEIGCFYLLVWGVLKLLGYRWNQTPAGTDAPSRSALPKPSVTSPIRWLAVGRNRVKLLIGLTMIALFADTAYWLRYRLWHRDLRVTVLDVKQGSASLLELPGGYNLMIDGGGFSDNSVFDIGERVIAPFLWQKKITTVDTLILTHPNSDHLNGLLYIAENFNVKEVWSNNEPVKSKGYDRWMEIVKESQIDMPDFRLLPRSRRINGVDLQILYPPVDFLSRKKKEKWRSYNNNSMVIKAAYKDSSFLFPGDIMTRAEKELSRLSGSELKSDFLLAPHHGSKTSSTQGFLDRVQPDIVGISLGWNTAYGFPHPRVLNRYEKMGCRLFRTDRDGALTMVTEGLGISVFPTLPPRTVDRLVVRRFFGN